MEQGGGRDRRAYLHAADGVKELSIAMNDGMLFIMSCQINHLNASSLNT